MSAASAASRMRRGAPVAEIDRLLDLLVDGVMSDLPGLVATAVARRAGR